MAGRGQLGSGLSRERLQRLEIFDTLPLLAKVSAVVREVAPEIVLTTRPPTTWKTT